MSLLNVRSLILLSNALTTLNKAIIITNSYRAKISFRQKLLKILTSITSVTKIGIVRHFFKDDIARSSSSRSKIQRNVMVLNYIILQRTVSIGLIVSRNCLCLTKNFFLFRVTRFC